MHLRFRGIDQPTPGQKTRQRFEHAWPAYKEWFLKEGEGKRPGYVSCRHALKQYMPELIPTWEKLSELAGGGDLEARLLSLYRPTPYLSGCSQAAWLRDRPLLARNYDYHPKHCEGVILKSCWNGTETIVQSDSLWGVLDGINEHGLVVSLAFGGRKIVGDGFGIPLVLRYILEFCRTTAEGVKTLERVPSHMAYNVHLLDGTGRFANVHVSPDRPATVANSPVATNHQREIEWTQHAEATFSLARERFLLNHLDEPAESRERFVERFLEPPLYNRRFSKGFGTLYTAVYDPVARTAEYLWPNHRWKLSFDAFDEGEVVIAFDDEDADAGESADE